MESLNALIQGMGLMHLGAATVVMLLVSLLLLAGDCEEVRAVAAAADLASAACSPISRRPGWRHRPWRACWLTTTRRSWR
ncbi:hypothetical protein CN260_18560 [Klebsiella pneumoniae]|nr:hypothetical protein CN260_18560 [Klebsiella pneumoniae]